MSLSALQWRSSLAFFAFSYIAISYIFKDSTDASTYSPPSDLDGIDKLNGTISFKKSGKKRSSLIAFIFVVVGIIIKIVYDSEYLSQTTNLYARLEVSRHSNTIEIRQTYKQLSKKYHPDKNPGKDYEDLFQKIKQSYDILMDEEKREIYNRFGLNEIEFDPRKDEMKLFGDLGIKYLFWGILMYIMTATPGAKASRTWNYIVGIILLALEFFLLLSETKLPQWGVFNMYLTEYELLMWIHTLFPAVIASLRILAEYLYVDVDTVTIMVLKDLTLQQQAQREMLKKVSDKLGDLIHSRGSGANSNNAAKSAAQEELRETLVTLCDQMELCNDYIVTRTEELRQCSSNPGANYYWLFFVLMYGGAYFLGQ